MATTFKTFLNDDLTTTRTLLHEAIPITGTISSGTYTDTATTTETSIKNYAHGMFQSVYDYPYLSSSANHIYDITCGYSAQSELSSSDSVQNAKKINIYNQMAQVLVGHDVTGGIRRFDTDGDYNTTGQEMNDVFFLNFARLLSKDEIKKGTFIFSYLSGSTKEDCSTLGVIQTISDYGAANDYRVNSPSGEFGLILTSSTSDPGFAVGHIYYQAGIAVITGTIFGNHDVQSAGLHASVKSIDHGFGAAGLGTTYNSSSFSTVMTGANITDVCDGIRNRTNNIQFNNTTELNSTIYFCRANHNDFNYSSNPTYVSGSKIRVKESTLDSPISYITTVGLYSADNELLGVAKVSEPIKKTPETELTLRVRLDY